MESESDSLQLSSSDLLQTGTQDNISQSTQLKRQQDATATKTWIHAHTAQGEEPALYRKNKILYCIHCTGSKVYSSSVTTNFQNHLLKVHQISVLEDKALIRQAKQEKLQELYDQINKNGYGTQIDAQVLQKVLNKQAIQEALVSLISVRSLPFRIVEWPEFSHFCQKLNPESKSVLTECADTVPRLVIESFSSYKDIVRRKLQSATSSVHISLDI